jgi:hypothetical protein
MLRCRIALRDLLEKASIKMTKYVLDLDHLNSHCFKRFLNAKALARREIISFLSAEL